MAALTMTPPTRQPFASLDTPRMRTLMRSKLNRQNVQNGIAISAKTPIFIDDDAENIDPNTQSLSSKRKRTFEDDDEDSLKTAVKPSKTSRMALKVTGPSTPLKITPATPKSAPILKPAGRSPPTKARTFTGRRSTIAKARPQSSKLGVGRPFSLATALGQGKTFSTSSSSKPQSQPKGPASWFFDIHVDSEQEEMTNLMQHSTGVLDISDDEGKDAVVDGRGKENVPPVEMGPEPPRTRASVSAAHKAAVSSKMDEDRPPLGELNAADYYAEDCNAFSYAVVHDDADENVAELKKASAFAFASAAPASLSQGASLPQSVTASIASVLDAAVPSKPEVDDSKTASLPDAPVGVCKSSSAAGEAVQGAQEKQDPAV
ncbi:hypothetical protein N7474_000125 [Penicillium riverlandense]|uniref:uncharacterized protein n=1 Tax=Penicillium riverlandense TaxID=1903569 RepID=UPI0025496245|nr:uncharacterized protein N7474_000125 [Penicillium riverlandense]KAJ5831814.1 hypothetical protein N7474_000125 [Penicillium riverlandense]